MTLQLTLTFQDVDELKSYIEDYESVQLTKIKKLFKKTSDKRGSSTKTLHQKAKEFQKENPTLSYKQSLQAIGAQIREAKTNKPTVIEIDSYTFQQAQP